jgi:carbamate kinase
LKIVVALGGNALAREHRPGTYDEMVRNVKIVCKQMMRIIDSGHQLVITHGNGPQVGNLALQQAATLDVPPLPLHILGSMTQGEVGYLLQRELGNSLRAVGSKRQVASVVTQTVVDVEDPAFRRPSKPIGPFYSEVEARALETREKFEIRKVGTGVKPYRRVVPSPDPKSIVEADVISRMLGAGVIVIAGGGGGVPVIRRSTGELVGIDAVIDKDLSAEKMAEGIRADVLLILTNIDKVKLNFGKKRERELDSMTVSEARKRIKEGEFPPGSMGPKVEACIRFVEWGHRPAIITSLAKAMTSLEGSSGTRITPD